MSAVNNLAFANLNLAYITNNINNNNDGNTGDYRSSSNNNNIIPNYNNNNNDIENDNNNTHQASGVDNDNDDASGIVADAVAASGLTGADGWLRSTSGAELASTDWRASGVSSTPSTPQAQRHVRSRARKPAAAAEASAAIAPGLAAGAGAGATVASSVAGSASGFTHRREHHCPQPPPQNDYTSTPTHRDHQQQQRHQHHHALQQTAGGAATATQLLKNGHGMLERNGNLSRASGGSLNNLAGSPVLGRRAACGGGGGVARTLDKNSANFLDYYLSLESAVRQKKKTVNPSTTETTETPAIDAPGPGGGIEPVMTTTKTTSRTATSTATPSSVQARAGSGPGGLDDPACVDGAGDVHTGGVGNDGGIDAANRPPLVDDNREKAADEASEKSAKSDNTAEVPAGWEKHEDDEGAYYWHIATGTIQREMPTAEHTDQLTAQHKRLTMPTAVTFRNKSGNANEKALKRQSCPILTRRAIDQLIQSNQKKKAIRFAVRSLGWLAVPEDELTPDKSSRAVNAIIKQLGAEENALLARAQGGVSYPSSSDTMHGARCPPSSLSSSSSASSSSSSGSASTSASVTATPAGGGGEDRRRERWGDGIDIYMDIDDECLRLIDPNKIKSKIVEIDDLCADDDVLLGGLTSLAGASTMTEEIGEEDECILLEQPIHTIRMWGVGRDKDSERDFAYVARDRVNKNVVLCHVFRCDMPARIIATTLRDACKRAMIERGLVVKRDKSTALPEERKNKRFSDLLLGADSFPQPSEEINKTLKALYVGSIEVSKPEGMDMLISAIDRLVSVVPPYRYRPVKVIVTTSAVTVRPQDNEREVVFDARVRFIEYIGMGRQEEMCSLVVDPNPGSSQRRFVAHVFHCEPTAAALTKALEAAYKLRYQKCLDAHTRPALQPHQQQQHHHHPAEQLPFNPNHGRAPPVTRSSSISQIGCTLRNVFSQTLRLVGSQGSNQI